MSNMAQYYYHGCEAGAGAKGTFWDQVGAGTGAGLKPEKNLF